jgi:GDPmannose 4,6-dehydratase
LMDSGCLSNIISSVQPDEIYNLGAQSHVKVSFEIAEYTAQATGLGALRILECMRSHASKAKFYQASSSEMFGASPAPQNEKTKFYPRSPYAVAKVGAFWNTVNHREAYGLFACNGILFNHESPRRGETFVTRKITKGLASILAGHQKKIFLGNMDAKRDWGFAPEFVEMMWLMLQQKSPDDFVVGTGKSNTVREFILEACGYLGIKICWDGDGVNERGIILDAGPLGQKHLKSGETFIEIDSRYFRPTEVEHLEADISKAKKLLGWQPRVNFSELVKIMLDFDLKAQGVKPIGDGINVCRSKNFGYAVAM